MCDIRAGCVSPRNGCGLPWNKKCASIPIWMRHTTSLAFAAKLRSSAVEKRRTQVRGIGREFESLREYQLGDEYRDICWTAAARRAKLVTRLYQVERSQTVWIVVDSGRLMRARGGNLSKLDLAVNAALSLAQVALYSGDRVGLVAYGRGIRRRLPAAKGSAHLRQMIEQLALVREETAEADHLQLAGRLLTDQKRRSLIVWLTDLAETAMTPEVIEAASHDDAASPCSVRGHWAARSRRTGLDASAGGIRRCIG